MEEPVAALEADFVVALKRFWILSCADSDCISLSVEGRSVTLTPMTWK